MSQTLKALIGIDSDTHPAATELLSEIPGIDTALLTALGVTWESLISDCYKRFAVEVLTQLAKRGNFQTIAERTRPAIVGYENVSRMTTTADEWHGVRVQLPVSRYQSIFIHSLFTRFTLENATIRIYSLAKAEQIGEDITADLVKGQGLLLGEDIDLDEYQNEIIVVSVLVPAGTVLESFGGNNPTRYTAHKLVRYAEDLTPTYDNTIEPSHCYVSLDYELRMSMPRVITNFEQLLKRPFGLYVAADLIKRALVSQSANVRTLVNRVGLADNYEIQKEEAERALAGSLRVIYPQLQAEKLALVSNNMDQPGYFTADAH